MVRQSSSQVVRTRIAPSPTGYPHIGTIYQALFNYAFAKKNKGKFVIRIEDTDRERFVADAEERLFAAMDWFGLLEDESPRKHGEFAPYRQSERLEIYKKYAQELIEKGHAYYCFCSKERLDALRLDLQKQKKPVMYDKHCRKLSKDEIETHLERKIPFVIRMKIPENRKITFHDGVRGDIEIDSSIVDEQIVMKSDGYPTYHLAAVVDDHLMQITHVVRAEEWISSTPKHILLYEYFGWDKPQFFHTALLRNPDKSKLSKRHGHTDVLWYKEEGYLPEAILNFMTLLGWTHPEEKEMFPLSEFIQLFDLKDIRPVGPIFDLNKLTWMNQQYIQMQSDATLQKLIADFFPQAKTLPQEIFNKLIPLVKTRMNALKDFENLTTFFFAPPNVPLNQHEKEVANVLRTRLENISDWQKETIFSAMKEVLLQYKVRMPLLYKILTGEERGLPLPESLEIVGKEKTLNNIAHVVKT